MMKTVTVFETLEIHSVLTPPTAYENSTTVRTAFCRYYKTKLLTLILLRCMIRDEVYHPTDDQGCDNVLVGPVILVHGLSTG
jgi:hypothetical protein